MMLIASSRTTAARNDHGDGDSINRHSFDNKSSKTFQVAVNPFEEDPVAANLSKSLEDIYERSMFQQVLSYELHQGPS